MHYFTHLAQGDDTGNDNTTPTALSEDRIHSDLDSDKVNGSRVGGGLGVSINVLSRLMTETSEKYMASISKTSCIDEQLLRVKSLHFGLTALRHRRTTGPYIALSGAEC